MKLHFAQQFLPAWAEHGFRISQDSARCAMAGPVCFGRKKRDWRRQDSSLQRFIAAIAQARRAGKLLLLAGDGFRSVLRQRASHARFCRDPRSRHGMPTELFGSAPAHAAGGAPINPARPRYLARLREGHRGSATTSPTPSRYPLAGPGDPQGGNLPL